MYTAYIIFSRATNQQWPHLLLIGCCQIVISMWFLAVTRLFEIDFSVPHNRMTFIFDFKSALFVIEKRMVWNLTIEKMDYNRSSAYKFLHGAMTVCNQRNSK